MGLEKGWDPGEEKREGVKLILPDRSGGPVCGIGIRRWQEHAFGSKAISSIPPSVTVQESEGTREPHSLSLAPPGTVLRTSKALASKTRHSELRLRMEVNCLESRAAEFSEKTGPGRAPPATAAACNHGSGPPCLSLRHRAPESARRLGLIRIFSP